MEYKNVYFLGIGGIGMSALARYFLHGGYAVAGYDRTPSHLTGELEAEGAAVHYEDDVRLIPEGFLDPKKTMVVYTPAVPQDHGEYRYFREHGFCVEKRSQMLGHLAEGKYVMAVAGTHGKTTTSTMVAWLNRALTGGGSAFLGGISKNFGGNLVLGDGGRLAVEADEFDRSFLRLYPDVAVVTSADADHLDIYGTHEAVKEAFSQFVRQIRPGGSLIIKRGVDIVIDNPGIAVYRYSYDEPCDFYARNVQLLEGGHYRYDLVTPSGAFEGCTLGVPGWVNIENAVAAVASVWCAAKAGGTPLDADKLRGALAFRVLCQHPEAGLYGRLRPSSARAGRNAHLRAEDVPRAADHGAVPAPPLHPYARPPCGVRRGVVACRRSGAAADLSGARGADSGHHLGDHRPTGRRAVPYRRPRPFGRRGGRDGHRRCDQLRRRQYRRLLPRIGGAIKNEKLNIKNTGICFWHFRFRLELMRSLLLDKNDFLRGLESA